MSTYNTVPAWIQALRDHPCQDRDLLSADDPRARMLGAVCIGCQEEFLVGLIAVRDTDSKSAFRTMLRTATGRLELMRMVRAGEITDQMLGLKPVEKETRWEKLTKKDE